jgi:hypothetical protein
LQFLVTFIYIANKTTLLNHQEVIMEENRNDFKFGFNPSAENWNGRLAMIGFVSALLIEIFSGQGVLHFWGLL